MRLRLGELQVSGLEIYVYDPAFDDAPAPGSLDGQALVYDATDRDALADRLTEAANSADDDHDADLREALTRLACRVRRS